MKKLIVPILSILLIFQFTLTTTVVRSTEVDTLNQGNTEFLSAINKAILEIIDDGSYETIYQDWFKGSFFVDNNSISVAGDFYPTEITPGGTLSKILETGVINWGADITYPPFEYKDNLEKTVGFDVDLGVAIASKLGNHYNRTISSSFVGSDWDPIIPNLISGQFDAILSAMTITTQRETVIDFSRPYYTSKLGLIANEHSPEVREIDDLDNSSLILGVQSGTQADVYAGNNLNMTIYGYTSFELMITAIGDGDVDFGLAQLDVAAHYASENPDLT